MGHNQSRSGHPTSPPPQPPSSATTNTSSSSYHAPNHPPRASSSSSTTNSQARREPRRRESVHTLPSVKATAAPPSQCLESATAHSQISQGHTQTSPTHLRSHTITIEKLEHQHAEAGMGNEESRPKQQPEGHNGEQTEPGQFNASRPVAVPSPSDDSTKQENVAIEPSGPPRDANYIPPPQTIRPPRLPLPIEEEIYTPGSPIISPADVTSALAQDLEAGLPRRSSLLSSTTGDDEDAVDDYQGYGFDEVAKKSVPTLIEWKQPGEKVYVTGTFAGWNKKFRLHKKESGVGFYAIIPLPAGTHHLKFLVDGDMRTADHLPTAVDFTNVLVNYLEVTADVTCTDTTQSTNGQHNGQPEQQHGIAHQNPSAPHPPDAMTNSPELRTSLDSAMHQARQGGLLNGEDAPKPIKYGRRMPPHLKGLDAPEGSRAHRQAMAMASKAPTPPGLPGFLAKSLLNSSTPMKDDSSVLNLPNHTVLNHLATSSIKDGVLATTSTTRYIDKYVTTILYKPTDGGEDEVNGGGGEVAQGQEQSKDGVAASGQA